MAKLILGPSGAGKSTLINAKLIESKNLIFGYELVNKKYGFLKFWEKTKKISKNSIIHYNILSCFAHQAGICSEKEILEDDKILKKILSYDKILDDVIILVAPVNELISRANSRKKVEDNISEKYDNEFWTNIIKRTNFYNLYKELFIILDSLNIKYRILYSFQDDFKITQKSNINKNLDGVYE